MLTHLIVCHVVWPLLDIPNDQTDLKNQAYQGVTS